MKGVGTESCIPNPRPLILVRRKYMGTPTRQLKFQPHSSRLRRRDGIYVPWSPDGRGNEAELVEQPHYSQHGVLTSYSDGFYPCSPGTGSYAAAEADYGCCCDY